MKTMKLGRALVAVLLVCALLFNWSPVRAEAISETVVVGGVVAGIAAAMILIALGVCPGVSGDDFKSLSDSLVNFWEDAGYVVNGMVDVFLKNGTSFLNADLIGFTKHWIWSEGILVDNFSILSEIDIDISEPLSKALAYSDIAIVHTTGASQYNTIIFYGDSLHLSLEHEWKGNTAATGRTTYYLYAYATSGYMYSWDDYYGYRSDPVNSSSRVTYIDSYAGIDGSAEIHLDGDIADYSTSLDLTLGDVAGPGEDLATGYPDWAGQSVALTPSGTDTVITGYPVSTPATYEEAITQTQTEAQSGTTSITDADVAVGTLDGTLAETEAKTFVEVIAGYFSNVVTAIKAIPEAIGTTFSDALTAVFIPAEDFLTAKVEAVRAEFAFADSIISSGELIGDVLNGVDPTPPIIYVDLGAFEGSYDIGGEVVLMDLSWYERYKATGDAIISAFLWLAFAWRMLIKAPGIISGIPGDFVMDAAHQVGLADHLPTRKAAYEVHRRDIRRMK